MAWKIGETFTFSSQRHGLTHSKRAKRETVRERQRQRERVRALGRACLVIQKNVVKCATQYLRKPTKTYDFSPCRKNTNLFALRFVWGQPLNLLGKTNPSPYHCAHSPFYALGNCHLIWLQRIYFQHLFIATNCQRFGQGQRRVRSKQMPKNMLRIIFVCPSLRQEQN